MDCIRCGEPGALMCHRCKAIAQQERAIKGLPSTIAGAARKSAKEETLVGITIDTWKHDIFANGIAAGGFEIKDRAPLTTDGKITLLRVRLPAGKFEEFSKLIKGCEKKAQESKNQS